MAYVNILDIIYPVGSIYITNIEITPASLFGGSWEEISEGCSLIGAGSSYAANQIYGNNTHTLTVSEMPAHSHPWREWFTVYRQGSGYDRQTLSGHGADPGSYTTGVSGGGATSQQSASFNGCPYLDTYSLIKVRGK